MENQCQLQTDLARSLMTALKNRDVNTKIAVMTFGSQPSVKIYLNDDAGPEALSNAVDELSCTGDTDIALALDKLISDVFTVTHGDRSNADNVIILMSDGEFGNAAHTKTQVDALHRTTILTMTVGFGDSCEIAELSNIASEPRNQNTFCLQNDNDITDTVADVLKQLDI